VALKYWAITLDRDIVSIYDLPEAECDLNLNNVVKKANPSKGGGAKSQV
jgi:hypothetical protein